MRTVKSTVIAVVLAAALTGCSAGSDDEDPTGTHPETGAAEETTEPEESSEPAAETTQAAEESEEAAAPSTDVEMLPVPDGGPSGIAELPVPAGTEIEDMGASGGSWSFVVPTSDIQSVLDFYAAVLPEEGYTLTEGVTSTIVDTEVDLGLSGPAYGTVNDASLLGGVNVIVADEQNWE